MIPNKIIWILSFCFLLLAHSCHRKSNEALVSLLYQTEISADTMLVTLDSLRQHITWDKHSSAYWNLLYLRAYEKKYAKLPSDSIVYKATYYFLLKGKPREQAYSYFYRGYLNALHGNDNSALDYYIKALELSKKEDLHELSGHICQHMAEVYWKDEHYQQYIDVLKQAVHFFTLSAQTTEQILSYRDISRGFLYQLEYDSALVYSKEGELLARKVDDLDGFLKIYYEIGSIYWVKKEYDLAELYITKAIKANTDPAMHIKLRQLLTSIYISEGKYEEAKELLIPLLSNDHISLEEKVANYHRMSNIEKGLNNYEEALKWYKEHKLLTDSVMYKRMNIDTNKVEISNRLEKLVNENNHLKRINLCSIFLVLICLILVSYSLFKSRKYSKKLIISEHENALLHNEQMLLQEKLLERSNFLQKATLLLKTPPHKRKELEAKMEKIFASSRITEEDWEELEELINKGQNDFATKFRKKYSILTEEEVRTLILIRLGINNNYLATLFNIQIDSIMTKRYRIRKKLEIPKTVSLEDFVQQPF